MAEPKKIEATWKTPDSGDYIWRNTIIHKMANKERWGDYSTYSTKAKGFERNFLPSRDRGIYIKEKRFFRIKKLGQYYKFVTLQDAVDAINDNFAKYKAYDEINPPYDMDAKPVAYRDVKLEETKKHDNVEFFNPISGRRIPYTARKPEEGKTSTGADVVEGGHLPDDGFISAGGACFDEATLFNFLDDVKRTEDKITPKATIVMLQDKYGLDEATAKDVLFKYDYEAKNLWEKALLRRNFRNLLKTY